MKSGTVLVFGDDTRAFLATIRSLGRRGLAVHAAPQDFRSAALRSRYVAEIHRLPAVVDDGGEWVAAVEELLRRRHFDLVMPCTDRTLLPLHTNRARLASFARLAIPAPVAIDAFFDKWRTRELAAGLGIPLAPAWVPQPDEALQSISARLGAKVVVKPRRSVRFDALHRQATVRMAGTPAELRAALAAFGAGDCYVESFFAGSGLGLSVLAERGAVLLAFEHHRIHQAAHGGSSAYRVSAAPSPELRAACGALCARVGFTGIAMFEFRRRPDSGAWILLEVNARPWGSLPLPVSLGVDFPYAWYRLLVDGVRPEPRAYRTGIHARNFDLDLAFAAKRAAETSGRLARTRFLAGWLAGFARIVAGSEKLDTLTADDPAPAVAEFAALAAHCGRRLAVRLPGQRALARARLRRALAGALRRGEVPAVAFVCYGNICRSAFAERALVDALAALAGRVTVRSAGTYQTCGRPSPDEAQAAARRRRVDLAPHRSARVTAELLRTSSVVIAFDRSNVAALRAQFPAIPCPIILFGALLGRRLEIVDPYGCGPAAFDQVFGLIEQGVAALRGGIAEALGAGSAA